MSAPQLRPDSTYVGAFSNVGASPSHVALSDNNDGTYIVNSFAGFCRVSLSSATIPAGAVFQSAQIFIRARQSSANATPGGCNVGLGQGNNTAFVDYVVAGFSTGFSTIGATVHNQNFSQAQLDDLSMYVQPNGAYWGIDVSEVYVNCVIAEAPTAPGWTGPGASVTTTLRPTFSWTHNAGANGGAQTWYQVRVFTLAQASIGGFNPDSSPATLDTGAVNSGSAAWVANNDLTNGGVYRAYVRTWATTHGVNQNSPWSAPLAFTMAVAVPVPTAVTPSTTQTTSRPVFNATVAAMSGGATLRRTWEVATVNTFAAIYGSYTESTYENSKSLAFTPTWGTGRLAQGTWYIRCKATDSHGVASAYSATSTFIVSHPPTAANRLPGSGESRVYATSTAATWTFQDPDVEDFQLKYEAELWKLSAPAVIKTTGVVTSAAQTGTWTALDATWKDTELRWRVRLYDQDNVVGAYSTDQAFFLRDRPTGTLTFPTNNQVITVAQPTITWNFSATSGRTQANWRVTVRDIAAGQNVADSGVIDGTATSYTVPSPVVQVGRSYSTTLTVTDSVGLTNTVTNNFTATYVAPPTPVVTLNTTQFSAAGLVTLDWSTSTVEGTNVGWKVLRRQAGMSAWTQLTFVGTSVKTYKDYTAPALTNLEYSVVQVAVSVGTNVDSAYPVIPFYGESPQYMLVCPEDESYNLVLYHVTSDDFEDEQEMATSKLIGRGRRVEYGTRYGQVGSLSADFRDNEFMTARHQRLLLEEIRDSGNKIYLRNPFGDVWAVALESARISRTAGVGLREMATVTIAYSEITA